MQKKLLITELPCVGNLSFWQEVVRAGAVYFEAHEHFQKTGFRNRFQVLSAQGVITLSIPVCGGREGKDPIKEVLIDYNSPWQRNHWRTLESCYNKSPFFFHYRHSLQPVFFQSVRTLWAFNLSLVQWVGAQLRLSTDFCETDSYVKGYDHSLAVDLRGILKTGNRNEGAFHPYQQVFGHNFEQNLSVFDLIFNLGPQSSSYLLH